MNYRRLLIIALAAGTVNAFLVGMQISEIHQLQAQNAQAFELVNKWEDTANRALETEKRWEAIAKKWQAEAIEWRTSADRCEGASHL